MKLQNFYKKLLGRSVATGKSSKEIGKLLFRSPRTIEWHFENIRHKFGCRTNVELISKIVHKNSE